LITLIHIDRHDLRNDSQLASKLVWEVETELARRGYRTGFIDGTDDPLTFDAILDYEGDAGLPLNGRVNPILLDSLEIADSRPVTMRDIDEIQRRLKRRGYAPGMIDGVVDGETKSAIEMYQADAGHAPTGRPTVVLLEDLRGLNSQSSSYVSRSGEL
jgi:peptidoglycan hydrolase-like protein with peptidoglycan-binding domain